MRIAILPVVALLAALLTGCGDVAEKCSDGKCDEPLTLPELY